MGFIRTVNGDIDKMLLGVCQCHEHLFIKKGKSFEVNPALWMDDLKATLKEVLLFKAAGGSALADAQPAGAGSMPEELQKVSHRTGIHIIASTGFHKRIFYPDGHWIFGMQKDQLAENFIDDIETGLKTENGSRCSAKAGFIKCAVDENGLDDFCERLFLAAASAAKKTGAPLMVHTENGAFATELIGYLQNLGVRAEKIIICHMERGLDDMDGKLRIAKTGVYMECDTIARYKYHSDEDEAMFLKRLCDKGFESRILLGLDTTRQRMKNYGGSTGLDFILQSFVPILKNAGVTEKQIHQMLVQNAADAFTMNNF